MGDGPRLRNRKSCASLLRNVKIRNDAAGSSSGDRNRPKSIGVIMKTVNLKEKFALFSDYYNPRVIGEVNDCHVKPVKLEGEFICLHHESADELFLSLRGTLRTAFHGPSAA